MSSTVEYMFYNTFNNVSLSYERINAAYAEAFVATLVILFYVRYRLKYWSWQGIPNDVASVYNRFNTPFHIADCASYKKFGKVVGIYEGFMRPALMVGDLCLVRQVLVKDFIKFPNRRFEFEAGIKVGSNFLFYLKFEAWNRVRSIIGPTFSAEKLKQMHSLIQESVDYLVHNMEVMSINGYTVDVRKYFGALSLDVIISCALGTKVNSLQAPHNDIVRQVSILGRKCQVSLSAAVGFVFPSIAKALNLSLFNVNALLFTKSVLAKVIEERRSRHETSRNDFIQLLIDSRDKFGSTLDLHEIIDQGIYLMISGSETMAAVFSSAAYFLATNPCVQEKLIDEIDTVFGLDDDFSYERLHQMEYLNAFVWEVLRYLPPIPRIERKAIGDCMLGNIFVPKDTLIIIPVYAIHHDAKNFEDPELFSPERFLGEKALHYDPCSLIPFGSGPRSCLGMGFALYEIKLCLVSILQKFRLEICSETMIPMEFFVGQLLVTPKQVVLRVVKR